MFLISVFLLSLGAAGLAVHGVMRIDKDSMESGITIFGQAVRNHELTYQLIASNADREQLRHELESIRQRHHTGRTIEGLEDQSAVLADIKIELGYIMARVNNALDINCRMRPGPYAYKAKNTASRPERPGSRELWRR